MATKREWSNMETAKIGFVAIVDGVVQLAKGIGILLKGLLFVVGFAVSFAVSGLMELFDKEKKVSIARMLDKDNGKRKSKTVANSKPVRTKRRKKPRLNGDKEWLELKA